MNDLIHRIVGVIIEAGQSDTTKFKLGETIRYSPSEILEILKQHESEIFGEGSSTQTNAFNTLNALDCISRTMALAEIRDLYPSAPSINFRGSLARWSEKNKQYIECEEVIKRLPSAQPDVPDTNVGDLISRQPEIIRCQNCIYWKTDHPTANGYHCCWRMHNIFPMKEDDFCSRAERSRNE